MKNLKKKWPWHPELTNAYLIICSLFGIIATMVSLESAGVQAFWFFTAIPVGFIFHLVYGSVGKRVNKLRAKYAQDPGEVVEGLLVIGKIQSPGVAILREDELELIPIVGTPYTVPLNKLEIFKEGHMLPGKFVWGKRAFILKPHNNKRLAFAIEESIGMRWSKVFVDK